MNRQTETLARIGLFRSLDADAIRTLDTQCSWRRTPRKQWIIDYQDRSNDVFFIVSGAARVTIQSVSGREALLREIEAGEFFGELAAIDWGAGFGRTRSATVAATMPARLLVLDWQLVNWLNGADATFAGELTRVSQERLARH
jgi:CRP/FNR family transcriptional regulator, cyclic AMP receptor protein